jgi:hypothetical protein
MANTVQRLVLVRWCAVMTAMSTVLETADLQEALYTSACLKGYHHADGCSVV